ncbi:MAG TPA: UDP-3-O-(3-hydroxymyristoyl)glucosamine N-acyltransferase [Candidatus Acidoferrales bacterium]|jgi:UDP-3-O-[3-hydroxymyristoyl] glucosamine N-acyltransferase|nr:UDP-3-O-(3-hydroxymyristoyl)glucosamine N-acyltransferase [Candidatus Acidoferrales bacterium]
MAHTAGELAEYLGAEIRGDAQAQIVGLASPEGAGAEDLIYVDSERHADRAERSVACCVIVPTHMTLAGKTLLEVANPKLAFAKAAAWLVPKPPLRPEIHPTAIVAATARLAPNIRVGPYVVIEDEVEIGSGTAVDAFCFVGRSAHVGQNCRLHPRVTLYPGARLKDRVEVHSGVVIGGDGFGYVFGDNRHVKFPQIGSVEIDDDVEIGCNSTIDRGSLDRTHVGVGVKIDNLVQIAHNVGIGENSVIAAQTGISGSSILGAGVVVGGQVGIADHCKLEDGSIVGAQAGVPTGKTIRRGQTVWGTPARPIERFKEQYGWISRLPQLAERLAKLEKKIGS